MTPADSTLTEEMRRAAHARPDSQAVYQGAVYQGAVYQGTGYQALCTRARAARW